mmetsp:Transcript_90432/g.179964  ORF Transcript_90432/g.179964 Transcript_90432/m.179964 type:complete len:203 (-) Transcript_90432:641-1249(-)
MERLSMKGHPHQWLMNHNGSCGPLAISSTNEHPASVVKGTTKRSLMWYKLTLPKVITFALLSGCGSRITMVSKTFCTRSPRQRSCESVMPLRHVSCTSYLSCRYCGGGSTSDRQSMSESGRIRWLFLRETFCSTSLVLFSTWSINGIVASRTARVIASSHASCGAAEPLGKIKFDDCVRRAADSSVRNCDACAASALSSASA